MVLSFAAIASSDCAIAAWGDSVPASMRRCRSAREIIGVFPWSVVPANAETHTPRILVFKRRGQCRLCVINARGYGSRLGGRDDETPNLAFTPGCPPSKVAPHSP